MKISMLAQPKRPEKEAETDLELGQELEPDLSRIDVVPEPELDPKPTPAEKAKKADYRNRILEAAMAVSDEREGIQQNNKCLLDSCHRIKL